MCVNDVGSFHCECFSGYVLNDDQISCRGTYVCYMVWEHTGSKVQHCFNDADLDECVLDSHKCTQECKNTKGSYQCFCNQGFTLGHDGLTCNGVTIIIKFVAFYFTMNFWS